MNPVQGMFDLSLVGALIAVGALVAVARVGTLDAIVQPSLHQSRTADGLDGMDWYSCCYRYVSSKPEILPSGDAVLLLLPPVAEAAVQEQS
jgi:hypothetical protein